MKIWRLKKGGDLRFRRGHPWIFSGEIAHSTKEVEPGECVELRDASDRFLAYGMAHPTSNISFRRLSQNAKETDVLSVDFFMRRLALAQELRAQLKWNLFSHRMAFAEADGLPGLVIDLFKAEEDLLVFQIATAGMDRARNHLLEALDKLKFKNVLEVSTSSHRKLEGLGIRRELICGRSFEVSKIKLKHLDDTLSLNCDFESGQKTGFFLDQQNNVQLLLALLRPQDRPLKILDLCCYVGQWSAQIAKFFASRLEVDLVDSSKRALDLAKQNCESFGASVRTFEMDILENWVGIEEQYYDIVICDPPAFVKKKADLNHGIAAYIKLNREAIRRVRPGGLFVTCSCSGAVRSSDFDDILVQAKNKASRQIRWLAHGGHPPDHPTLLEFPEGEYLKCRIGRVDLPL